MTEPPTYGQEWCCEYCGRDGEVRIPVGADLFSGFYMIEDAHRKTSPDCTAPEGMIRVRNNRLCSWRQWRRIKERARVLAGTRLFA